MFSAVNGYYNGSNIVLEDNVELREGQKVIAMILDVPQKKKEIDLDKYIGRGKKLFDTDAGEFVKELRNDDRL